MTQRGFTIWFTGLSGAGKSTLAEALEPVLKARGHNVEILDGDIVRNEVPYNPLHDRSYPSVSCTYCTKPVQPGDDPRSGRWQGFDKTECGLHVEGPIPLVRGEEITG